MCVSVNRKKEKTTKTSFTLNKLCHTAIKFEYLNSALRVFFSHFPLKRTFGAYEIKKRERCGRKREREGENEKERRRESLAGVFNKDIG